MVVSVGSMGKLSIPEALKEGRTLQSKIASSSSVNAETRIIWLLRLVPTQICISMALHALTDIAHVEFCNDDTATVNLGTYGMTARVVYFVLCCSWSVPPMLVVCFSVLQVIE